MNSDAVKDAIANAKRNKMDNIRFYCDDAGKFMTKMAANGQHADVVFMDPPRSGSDEAFLSCVAKLAPKRIVYISCGPETLARDLGVLKKRGYKVEKMVGVDLFPMTQHVETVVLLSQQKPDDTIEIDLDATAAETKATYEEIKAYVWEKHHLKVSSLYISQIERKCGLEVGQNYNLSKSENPKVPKCPPEKEAAIMDALKHFQMI